MVERWEFDVDEWLERPEIETRESPSGEYVLFTDYDSLERERDGLREALDDILRNHEAGDKVDEIIRAALAKGADHER